METAETMPVEPGWRVPAYLLIPKRQRTPMPAMVCFHQCAGDCVVAKEAVVGKVPWSAIHNNSFFEASGRLSLDRSDQAYGYELVHEGFVVLAPDSINCGERNIEAIRKQGEDRLCHQIIDEQLGQDASFKRATDAVRAVDVLESLDFVDSARLGAAGHSMGAGVVYDLMALDDRVKAGILGSHHVAGKASRFYPLIAPRLLMALWGAFDIADHEQQELQAAYDFAHACYEEAGARENLLIRKIDCGHWFADEFKWEAYRKLKEHFGILPERESASLLSIAKEARLVTQDGWEDEKAVFAEPGGQDCPVTVNREQMVSALAGLFLYLSDRAVDVTLSVRVEEVSSHPCLQIVCSSGDAIPNEGTPSGFSSMRGVRQILAEHDVVLEWSHSGTDLACRLAFGSCESVT